MVEDVWEDIANSLADAQIAMREVAAQKDHAYWERDQLVVALSKLFPSWLSIDEKGGPGWRAVVFINLPTGQVSWHIPDAEIPLFKHLSTGVNSWDGHSVKEKYDRIAALGV